jgi:hypothetical protein
MIATTSKPCPPDLSEVRLADLFREIELRIRAGIDPTELKKMAAQLLEIIASGLSLEDQQKIEVVRQVWERYTSYEMEERLK